MAAQSDPLVMEMGHLEIPCNNTGEEELSDKLVECPSEEEPIAEGLEADGRCRGKRDQLRAILDLYQRALEDLKAFALEKSFDKHFDISDGDKLYDRLETKITSPDFLEKLGREASVKAQPNVEGEALWHDFQSCGWGVHGTPSAWDVTPKHECFHEDISLENMSFVGKSDEQSSWDLITERDLMNGDVKDSRNCLDPESYVLVNQEDIVEGMACFMARYISSLPQTKQLTPKQLQSALKKAFGVPKKGRFRKLWSSSKAFYTAASWGATAVSLYNNPALVQAASSAFWTSIQVVTKYV